MVGKPKSANSEPEDYPQYKVHTLDLYHNPVETRVPDLMALEPTYVIIENGLDLILKLPLYWNLLYEKL